MFDSARRDEAARSVDRFAASRAAAHRAALLADAVEEGARAAGRDLRYQGRMAEREVAEVAVLDFCEDPESQAAWVAGYGAVAVVVGAEGWA